MEKTSKIIKCEFKNEWANPKGGSIFYHNIEFENGDKGSIGTKSKMPDKLNVGSELTYTIEGDKIKAVQQQNFKGGGFKQEPFEHKAAAYAMSYAKDLVVADKVDVQNLRKYADKIYEWLISKKR